MVVLEVSGGVLIDAGARWHVCLRRPGRSGKAAYLDKKRVKKFFVYKGERGPRRFFVEYETTNSYYDDAAVELPPGAREASIKEFNVNPWWLKPVKFKTERGVFVYYRVYLYELEEWDRFTWQLCTAISIYMTNIHPVYGVLD